MKNFSVDKIFAEDVFTDAEMEKRISKEAYESYRKTVDENVPLKRAAADEIAKAMMAWAIEKGATHYTHWFQPMTGVTAEKHEAFIEPDGKGGVSINFRAKCSLKANPTLQASRAEVCARRSKREVTPHGIRPPEHSLKTVRYIFPPFSALTAENRSTKKLLFLKVSKLLTKTSSEF